ncbi:MAG: excinuclease ABC subunit UvrC [Ignavibacteria bacterium]|nr:excinuclease ABC subunit UvrC [Ignavibacteria bacterium]MBT8392304.1 excinuclease ABC subunit UvrC [Ignavibacteria bacterium]
MNTQLQNKLSNLPANPGVYQFLNDKGKVIYVGKANNLRSRVKSYFQSNYTNAKTKVLVSKIKDIELIVTDTEVEALVLENNLIKELKPRYNVNLKDDKSFPFIKVTNEPYPRVYSTRRVVHDGSKYFGPYTSVKNMKSALRMINQIFKIRSCKYDINDETIAKKKFKICLDYHINKCDGPCEGLVSEKEYNEMVDEVVKVIRGRTDELIEDLESKMNSEADAMQFEKAGEIRDKIEQLKIIAAKQKVVSNDFEDRDVISIAFEDKDSACSVFNIRNGKLVGKKQLKLRLKGGEELDIIYNSAIKFYYGDFTEIPKEILLETEPTEINLLEEWLNQRADRKVKFIIPQRGELRSLVKMCKENAILQLKEIQIQKMKKEGSVSYSLSALQRDLRLKNLPTKIECFDISNIQGSDSVASMVVFVDGKPKKSEYKKFIIKSVTGPDDFASMHEVIKRRYTRLLANKEPLPDLIIVDGGKGQLSTAVQVLIVLGIKQYNIIGLAKRLEEVFFPGKQEPESIPKTSSGLKLLQQIRDEAHRFAVTFHRQRRSKRTIKTELTDIKGIGNATAQKLLKALGSVDKIKRADFTTLSELVGDQKANLIRGHYNQNKKE